MFTCLVKIVDMNIRMSLICIFYIYKLPRRMGVHGNIILAAKKTLKAN